MALKLSKNRDEICYPFIQDASVLCDFEVVTDELCGHIGEIIDLSPLTIYASTWNGCSR
ncbi:hypothetical protein NA645_08655 [Pseudomonas stutzeri]|uniref:hypothetical protein n=1 Tax=Stutzerimonas stutzeri TaxID=316 RepID=UPI002108AC6E|nr:hypothetical protein [Stutzerimonas stutzeri]MCQ4308055.1 hypothetical protein [Stutzerimonas stutzeri]